MAITIKINNIDKTGYFSRVSVENNLFSEPDFAKLEYYIYGAKNPNINGLDDVVVYDGETKIFGGKIIKIKQTLEGGAIKCVAEAKDYSEIMDGKLIFERFEDKTVAEIIDYLVEYYCNGMGITTNNVNCDAKISYIIFNGKPLSKCIDELANLLNYCWYIDPDKDIHFFSRGDENAPLNLTDTSGGYVFESLAIDYDWSNLINSVIIEGGKLTGNYQRFDFIVWENDIDDNRTIWPTIIEFAEKPRIFKWYGEEEEYEYSVGVNGLDSFDDYEVLWDFNGKFVRWREESRPGLLDKITLIGRELIPIKLMALDQESIIKYGPKEKYEINKDITSYAQAAQYAASIMDAYKEQICEGEFRSYMAGWRAGQMLNVNSEIRGINQNFIIKKVNFEMRSPTDFEYKVSLITQKTLGIVEFLQGLLLDKAKELEIDKDAILTRHVQRVEEVSLSESIVKDLGEIQPTYVVGEYFPPNPWPTNTTRTATIDSGITIQ